MSSAPGIQPEWPPPEAAADVVRLIAHDLRQPLSTIESIAYYLSLVLPRGTGEEAKIHEQLQQIQQLVEQSSWILTSGVQLTDISRAAPDSARPRTADRRRPFRRDRTPRSLHRDWSSPATCRRSMPIPDLSRALIENLLTLFRQLSTQAASGHAAHACGIPARMAGAFDGRDGLPFRSCARAGNRAEPGERAAESSRRMAARSSCSSMPLPVFVFWWDYRGRCYHEGFPAW